MSADSELATVVAVGHPRRAVIDQAWRSIGPGVEVLSGDDGGPLSRTVKRIIDPLVLRLRANPQYSAHDVRSLLKGVARSVSLDHRQRIKACWN